MTNANPSGRGAPSWILGTVATALAAAAPSMAAAVLLARAAEARDADLQAQLIAAGCWEPSR